MSQALKILVVSGPTVEPIDPVRFLTNRSTGTMGRYLVAAAKARGHRVSWVRCPEDAETARDLLKKLRGWVPKYDVFFMVAAVCDVRPAGFSSVKLKKTGLSSIRLVKNPDILQTLARRKKKGQIFLGFGIESKGIMESGFKKLRTKGLDAILMQKVTTRAVPFGDRKVDAFLLKKDGSCAKLLGVRKPKVAKILVQEAEKLFLARWPRS